jgi:hypothetical protein
LAEELESLEVSGEKSEKPEPEKRLKKKLVLNLDNLDSRKSRIDDSTNWILLDVNFGIPLFDTSLNQNICKRIVQKQLWKQER